MTIRLLDATASDFAALDGAALAESIRLAEGRTLAAEVIVTAEPPIDGVSHGEIAAAAGADVIVLDGYDPLTPRIAGVAPALLGDAPLSSYSALVGRPVGINLICADAEHGALLGGRLATAASIEAGLAQGVDLFFLYARPRSGGTLALQAETARRIAQMAGRRALLVGVPTFLKPPPRSAAGLDDHRAGIAALLDAGCGAVALPMPGSKQGWLSDATAALIDLAHEREALAWLFVTGSIEGAPLPIMHDLALHGKQLGADAFRLDEAGLSGMAPPENIQAFSLALRGARHHWRRVATSIKR